jgi:hypothetical protein
MTNTILSGMGDFVDTTQQLLILLQQATVLRRSKSVVAAGLLATCAHEHPRCLHDELEQANEMPL